MGVLIDNRQSNIKISQKKMAHQAQAILNALGFPDAELSIVIADDSQIAELNEKYLNRCGPTNVMAFPMWDGNSPQITPQLLGDVVISAETARREGMAAGISSARRLAELLVHGILHLFGYDHEKSEAELLRMQTRCDELLDLLSQNQS